ADLSPRNATKREGVIHLKPHADFEREQHTRAEGAPHSMCTECTGRDSDECECSTDCEEHAIHRDHCGILSSRSLIRCMRLAGLGCVLANSGWRLPPDAFSNFCMTEIIARGSKPASCASRSPSESASSSSSRPYFMFTKLLTSCASCAL